MGEPDTAAEWAEWLTWSDRKASEHWMDGAIPPFNRERNRQTGTLKKRTVGRREREVGVE